MKKYSLIILLVFALLPSCMEEPIVEPNTSNMIRQYFFINQNL